MNDDQFTRLFKYMNERFDTLEAKLDAKDDRDQLDSLAGELKGELAAIDLAVGIQRHEQNPKRPEHGTAENS
ncbi:hypothetical protein [Frankia sp. R43]|uniref:hypothetical protein n=1 Tax=Frankia sp. R43 TaxID=269536 RepID=UPI000ACF1F66|nr:hypothetical protein [Frankia sp. R43]